MILNRGSVIAQGKMADRATAKANPLGDILYVDSDNGNDGNSGKSMDQAFLTLTQALTVAEAGDTIILNKGGSETVTATLTVSLANLKIICPGGVDNPENGFNIVGAGTLALMTISGANVHVEGIKFSHTGATANAQCILTTAAADRLVVKNCLFDDSAITTTFTGIGLSIIDAVNGFVVDGCIFKDIKFGVKYTIATGVSQIGSIIKNCLFFIGKSAAFGIATALTGTGAVKGAVIENNRFLEANGDGSPATTAWDGTDGTNGTQGPIKAEAAFDQYIIQDNTAYTALSDVFDNLNAIASGAAGAKIGNKTALGADLQDFLTVATVDGTADSYMRDVVGKKTDATVQAVATTKSLMAYLKGVVNGLFDTAGIAAFPAAAAPGNAVSLAEVIRAIYDRLIGDGTDAAVNVLLGKRVTKATADTFAVANTPIFTIAGGRVLITALYGEVTTIIGAGANNIKLQMNPAVGTTIDMCAVLDIDADEVGTLWSLSGPPATALLRGESGSVPAMAVKGVVADIGDIEVNSAGNVTGSAQWTCWYIPLDDGATVVAA